MLYERKIHFLNLQFEKITKNFFSQINSVKALQLYV